MNHKAQLISDKIKLEKELKEVREENERLKLQILILELKIKELEK